MSEELYKRWRKALLTGTGYLRRTCEEVHRIEMHPLETITKDLWSA